MLYGILTSTLLIKFTRLIYSSIVSAFVSQPGLDAFPSLDTNGIHDQHLSRWEFGTNSYSIC